MKSFKQLKLKHAMLNFVVAVVFVLSISLFYFFHPDFFELKLPSEADLQVNPSLRQQSKIVLHAAIRSKIISTLESNCDILSDYNVLFCQNVLYNGNPIMSPCFMTCEDKQFYYDLEVISVDDDETISCTEKYATLSQTVRRGKNVLLRGQSGEELEEFTMKPSSLFVACLMQHANEVSRGQWLK